MDRIRKQVLQALFNGNISVYKLIAHQDSSLKEVYRLLQDLNEDLITLKDGRVGLTEKGVKACSDLGLKKVDDPVCGTCGGTGYSISNFFSKILAEFSNLALDRPEAVERYDQGFMSLDGVIRRLEFIYERGDLVDSKIFVMGDDDLLSLAAGLTGMPRRVHVVDIDERLVSFINEKAEEMDLPIKAETYDVQQPLPNRLKGKFDIFVTDPVETLPGIKLFLSRATSSLKGRGSSGYCGLTTLEASRHKWYDIQKMLLEMGFVITDIRRKFNVYPMEEKNFFRFQDQLPIVQKLKIKSDCDWYTSAFIRVEAVKEPTPPVEGAMLLNEKVYRDDESWATPY